MTSISRRTFVWTALMGGAALAAHEARPTKMMTDEWGKLNLADCVPANLPGWTEDKHAPVVLANPGTEALIKDLYTEVLTRAYVDNQDGSRVMLSLAYGANQADDKAVHYPDACYPAQGFTVGRKTEVLLNLDGHTLKAYQMLATLGPRLEHITFWAMVGDRPALGPVSHKLTQLSFGLRGYIPDGLLFRVSTIEADPVRANDVQMKFLRALHRSTAPEFKSRLFGA